MARLGTALGEVRWQDLARRLATLLNPVVASPAAPLEAVAGLEALGPSLMPRTSRLQGIAMGLSVLGARATTGVVEQLTRAAVPAEAPLGRRLVARAAIGGAGVALSRLPERDGERLWMASLRTTGLLLRAGAAGGTVHDLGEELQARYPAQRALRPVVVSAALAGGLAWWGGRRLTARTAAVQSWPLPQRTTLPGTLATSYVVTTVGTGLTRGYVWTRGATEGWFGPGLSKRLVARVVHAGLWAGAATAAYNAGVAYIGRANEKVEPAYATPPATPLVSGSPESLLPFDDLGQQGRRYVTDVVTPELVKEVMGEDALAHPVRTYVGFNSEPIYPTGRAELALAELERTGAFDRSVLLLVSPTGTGWVDHTLI
ncbi:MAG TPA: alpha/beta-hydrolase N-terminal domain-containing protein, partial [Actinomycetota bacterium]|nr:alpha/beta-hydrolase N-terminal domain-containing protein [Actinomycetota bacterium]